MTEWNASAYKQQSGLQAAMASEQLGRLSFGGGERVLDVGCGDGRITAEIARRVPRGRVLGIDPSQNMITFASQQFGAETLPNLRFEVADARELKYRGEFDRVVSFNALHWVLDQAAALRSIRVALADAGQAFLRFVPDGPRVSLEDVIEEVRRSARWANYFEGFAKPFAHLAPEEYRELARSEGFSVHQLNVEDRAWDFQTPDAFAAFARATFVEWTRRLPDGDAPAFINDVLERYRGLTATRPDEAHTFKFYQLEAALEPA